MYVGNTHVALAPSEIQEEQDLQKFKLISDHATDGISIVDRDGRFIYVNQTLCNWAGYTQEEYLCLQLSDRDPDYNQVTYQQLFDRAFQEVIPPVESMLKRKDGSTFPVEVSLTGVIFDGRPLLFGVARDITLRKQVEEQRERHMRYVSLRADISHSLAQHSSLDIMLQRCCEAIVYHLHVASSRIWTMNEKDQVLELQASAGISFYHLDTQKRMPVENSKIGDLVREQRPYLVNDVLSDPRINDKGWVLEEGIVAVASYPLIVDEQVVGMMTLFAQKQFTEETFDVLTLVADAIAQGIGRKWAEERLEKQVEQRTRELSLLLQVSHTVASTLERQPLLNTILAQLKSVVEYSSAILYDIQEGLLVPLAYRSVLPTFVMEQLVQLFQQGPVHRQVSHQGKSFIINDLPIDKRFTQCIQQNLSADAEHILAVYRSCMVVPLIANERSIGLLGMAYHSPNFYTQRHADLAFALANQAAIALENASLYEQARALAALQERQYLARELHDSVSQELYGVVLNAQIAHEVLETDPDEARTALDHVIEHADSGQTEMRSLLFELVPQALAAEGLVAALQKRVMVIRKHYKLNVAASLSAEPACSLEKKHALYRIAQEALHNVIKHAHATVVTLQLAEEEHDLLLEVCDNGKGFDPTFSFSAGLGLQSMKERAARLHGILSIRSKPEQGSSISVRIPVGA
jgi:PAS domain S-box-containing protein